jgi:hypothetical protein
MLTLLNQDFKYMNNTAKRMEELMVLVDKSLMLTDNDNERLMLACAMMQRTNEIFEEILGEQGRKSMYKELV